MKSPLITEHSVVNAIEKQLNGYKDSESNNISEVHMHFDDSTPQV